MYKFKLTLLEVYIFTRRNICRNNSESEIELPNIMHNNTVKLILNWKMYDGTELAP